MYCKVQILFDSGSQPLSNLKSIVSCEVMMKVFGNQILQEQLN